MRIKGLLKGVLRSGCLTIIGCIILVQVVYAQGVVNDGLGVRYMLSDGTYAKNCRRVSDGFAMHFDSNGYMDLCGFEVLAGSWKNTKKGKRYMFTDGRIPVGGPWLFPDGNYYTFDDNGYLVRNSNNLKDNSNKKSSTKTNEQTSTTNTNIDKVEENSYDNLSSKSNTSINSSVSSTQDLEKKLKCTIQYSQGIDQEWCQIEIENLSDKTVEINDIGFVESGKSYTVYHGANFAAAFDTKTILESGMKISQLYHYDGDTVRIGTAKATTYMVISAASKFKVGVTIDGTKYWLCGDCNGNTSLEKWAQ